ncbi:metalloenzyme, partial [bacterium]|nr:metalloenzyme [bacterium]
MSILMVFIDGIGIGQNDSDKNPFARYFSPLLSHFSDQSSEAIPYGGRLVPTDPTMGLTGLPQS